MTGLVHRMISSAAVAQRDRSSRSSVELVGVLEQREQPAGERVAGGVVAGRGEDQEVRDELHVADRLTVDGGVHQGAVEVVGRLGQPVLLEAPVVLHHLHRQRRELRAVVGVLDAEHGVGDAQHEVLVLRGGAEHTADHLQRVVGGEVEHEVERLVLRRRVEQVDGDGPDRRLERADRRSA